MKLDEAVNVRLGYYKRAYMFECGVGGAVVDRLDRQLCIYATDTEHTVIYCALVFEDMRKIAGSSGAQASYRDGKILLEFSKGMVVIDFEKKQCSCSLTDVRAYGSDEWGDRVFTEWDPGFNALFDK